MCYHTRPLRPIWHRVTIDCVGSGHRSILSGILRRPQHHYTTISNNTANTRNYLAAVTRDTRDTWPGVATVLRYTVSWGHRYCGQVGGWPGVTGSMDTWCRRILSCPRARCRARVIACTNCYNPYIAALQDLQTLPALLSHCCREITQSAAPRCLDTAFIAEINVKFWAATTSVQWQCLVVTIQTSNPTQCIMWLLQSVRQIRDYQRRPDMHRGAQSTNLKWWNASPWLRRGPTGWVLIRPGWGWRGEGWCDDMGWVQCRAANEGSRIFHP